jgi:hypothetical protein
MDKKTKAKLKHNGGREWCGYLTPAEILAICAAGAETRQDSTVSQAKRDKADGRSTPTWFYFQARKNSDLEKLLSKQAPS